MLKVTCHMCRTVHQLDLPKEDVDRWLKGELIQVAMPYLEAEVRELLISGTCGDCFDKMFPDD